MRVFIIALLLVWGGEALAVEDRGSANHLLPGCQAFIERSNTTSDFLQGTCAGQVDGVLSMQQVFGTICMPNSVTVGQAVRVVIQFITARPARMHENFSLLVQEALLSAWPCKK